MLFELELVGALIYNIITAYLLDNVITCAKKNVIDEGTWSIFIIYTLNAPTFSIQLNLLKKNQFSWSMRHGISWEIRNDYNVKHGIPPPPKRKKIKDNIVKF